MNVHTVVAFIGLLSVGAGAWVDVKSDIAVNQEKNQTTEKQLDKIEDKVDKIYDYLIQQGAGDTDG